MGIARIQEDRKKVHPGVKKIFAAATEPVIEEVEKIKKVVKVKIKK